MIQDVHSFIDGAPAHADSWIERENPTRPSETVGRVSAVSTALTAQAVEAAHRAFEGWAALPFAERVDRLLSATTAVMDERESLAQLLTRELGKVVTDTRGEIGFTAAFVDYCATVAGEVLSEQQTDDDQGRLLITQHPYGVVGAITPWNAPVILATLKVAPAILTGNTIVVKPSPLAPLAITRVLGLMAEQLPDGVLNVVNGGGAVGETLVGHPLTRKVAFTGGGSTGRAIMAAASTGLKPLVLELGGNDPAIFLDDADLTPASVGRAVFASFLTSGQVCMAAKRLYVHASRVDEFIDVYRAVADEALIVGDPLEESVTMGPMVSRQQVDRVQQLLDDAANRGGQIHTLGTVAHPELLDDGYFLRPALVTGVAEEAPIVCEEQFGPIVPLLPFDDEDEVVARANDDELGLASSVWSSDEDRAFALGRRLRCGYTFVNSHNRSGLTLRAPFGGFRGSGFGREFGQEGVAEYLQPHALHLPGPVRSGATALRGNAYPGQ